MNTHKRKLIVSAAIISVSAVAAVVGAQVAPGEDPGEPDRCSGTKQPICREVETCIGIGETRRCTTDYYYFPGNE